MPKGKKQSRGPRRKTLMTGQKKVSKNRMRRAIRGEKLRGRGRALLKEVREALKSLKPKKQAA